MELTLWRWAKYRPRENRAFLKAQVRAEVVSLSSLEREVVLRHFWGDRTIAEIGELMSLSEESVKKLLEMGLSTIRRRLVETGLGKGLTPA